ncbi:MAG: hypothetical protein ACM3N1_00220 [Accumulibacter sp.]
MSNDKKNQNKTNSVNSNNDVVVTGLKEILNRILETIEKYDPNASRTEFVNRIEEILCDKFNYKKLYNTSLREKVIFKENCTSTQLAEVYSYLINEVLAKEEYIHRQHITATILKLEPDTLKKFIEVTLNRYHNILDIEPYDISPVANCATRMLFPVNDHDLPQDIYPFGISVAFGDFENYQNEAVLKQVLDYINDPENLYSSEEE